MSSKILVVDDSAVMRALLDAMLRKPGEIEVVQATDGVDALAKLDEERFALVVTDLSMPKLDGGQLVERIRARADLAGLPVIVLTTRSNAAAAATVGASAVVTKPLDRAELLATVRRLLAR